MVTMVTVQLCCSLFIISHFFVVWRTLKDWASENKEVLNFSKDAPEKDMSECTFDDISIVLGRTYVFLHHGNCEHEISFVDLRWVVVVMMQNSSVRRLDFSATSADQVLPVVKVDWQQMISAFVLNCRHSCVRGVGRWGRFFCFKRCEFLLYWNW